MPCGKSSRPRLLPPDSRVLAPLLAYLASDLSDGEKGAMDNRTHEGSGASDTGTLLMPAIDRAAVAQRVADWRGILRRGPVLARQILRKIFPGVRPIALTPPRAAPSPSSPTR